MGIAECSVVQCSYTGSTILVSKSGRKRRRSELLTLVKVRYQ